MFFINLLIGVIKSNSNKEIINTNKDEIIEEAKYLVSQGYQEIVLTGIHVGGYGRDIEGVEVSIFLREKEVCFASL